MTISKTQVYKTSEGTAYPTFKEAKLAQDVIDRRARVLAMFGNEVVEGFLSAEAVANIAAAWGPKLLAALTLPSGRKPRTTATA